jgi:O-antigen ligase
MDKQTVKNILFQLGISGYIIGLFLIDVARVTVSISMIVICLLAISEWIAAPRTFSFKIAKPYLYLTADFLVILPSGLYSENQSYFFERAQILLPFLLLPLAFFSLPKLTTSQFQNFILLYIGLTFIVCLQALVFYFLNQEMVNQLYLESKVMPTFVTHHPTFSMMIVMAIFLCYYLYVSSADFNSFVIRRLVLIIGLFLFIFIHIYSVRSGLLAMYILIFWEIFQCIFFKKQFKNAILGLIFIVGIGSFTLLTSPTVRNKVINSTKDIEMIKSKGSANHHSMANRLISYKNAIQIASESSILFGCGLGDIEDVNNQIFNSKYPDIDKKILPHNQFLFFFASIGLIGLILFMVSFYFPLKLKYIRNNQIIFTQYILLSTFFLVEAPLETQLGVGFSLLFILLPMQEIYSNLDN